MNIETKIRNIRFIGELCKFRIAPASTVFSCLKEIAFQSLMMLQEMVILLIVHKLCGRLIIGVHVQSNFAGDGKRRWTSLVARSQVMKAFTRSHGTHLCGCFTVCSTVASEVIH
uniref:Uncharacterized protein n=1 Tax=Salix viminalis TaxID=40686 RepID=A0A6N2K2T6_SALVM